MSVSSSSKYDSIEIISGCMFSGKTEELLRRINIANSEGQKTALFKPEIDNRYHKEFIVSHNGTKEQSFVIKNSKEILNHIKNIQVIGIDEAQFFDNDIINVCQYLANTDCKIIIAGLDKDFKGNPFGPMPGLMEMSSNITLLNAICHQCGDKAFHTFKKSQSEMLIEIGEKNIYEARCLACYQKG